MTAMCFIMIVGAAVNLGISVAMLVLEISN
jgi:hypothetical protein